MSLRCRANTKDYFRFDPQLHLRFDGNPAKNAEIRAERLTPEQIVALEAADEKRLNALRKECGREDRGEFTSDGNNHLFQCGAGSGSFTVGYDGRFRLCPSLCADGTTYDLKTGTLTEAWNVFMPKVREMRSQRQEFLNTCRRCALGNLCFWCPAHAHLETGEMDRPVEYFCRVAHARALTFGPG